MKPLPVWAYILAMALVTYAVRATPFALFRRRIRSRFIQSLLYYMPFAVLSAMTIPAIFASTGSVLSACAGFLAASALALLRKPLPLVAAAACLIAYLTDIIFI